MLICNMMRCLPPASNRGTSMRTRRPASAIIGRVATIRLCRGPPHAIAIAALLIKRETCTPAAKPLYAIFTIGCVRIATCGESRG